MANSPGISKTAGRIGSMLALVGLLSFFIGIFGGPREFAIAGVAMMVSSMVGFFIEEQGERAANRSY